MPNLSINTTDNLLVIRTEPNNLRVVNSPVTIQGNGVVSGSNTQVQFNNGGDFGSSANLRFLSDSNQLVVEGTISGNSIIGTLATSAQPNITSVGTLTGLNVSGNITTGNIVGNIATSAQPNITSVGTLTGLNVGGNIATGNISATGNIAGSFLYGDGRFISNLSASAGSSIEFATSNVTILPSGHVGISVNNTPYVAIVNSQGINVNGSITANSITAASVNSLNTFGFKNRIINGDWRVNQQQTTTAVTPSNGTYTFDRWMTDHFPASKFQMQINGDGLTPPPGFANYMAITSLSQYTPVTTNYIGLQQMIEGNNISDLAWGTTDAKPVTLSFYVRGSIAGTYSGSVGNYFNATPMYYVFDYTINQADTWEFKTIQIPGATTGTWYNDTRRGIVVRFDLGSGPQYAVSQPFEWLTRASFQWAYKTTNAINLVETSGAKLYITGIQFECGNIATDWDYRDITTELNLCRRYRQILTTGMGVGAGFTTISYFTWPLNPAMRVAPINILVNGTPTFYNGVNSLSHTGASVNTSTTNTAQINVGVSTAAQAGYPVIQIASANNYYIAYSELT